MISKKPPVFVWAYPLTRTNRNYWVKKQKEQKNQIKIREREKFRIREWRILKMKIFFWTAPVLLSLSLSVFSFIFFKQSTSSPSTQKRFCSSSFSILKKKNLVLFSSGMKQQAINLFLKWFKANASLSVR